jgi:hypothetical protein
MKNEKPKQTSANVSAELKIRQEKKPVQPRSVPESERTRDTDFHHVHSFTNLISH